MGAFCTRARCAQRLMGVNKVDDDVDDEED